MTFPLKWPRIKLLPFLSLPNLWPHGCLTWPNFELVRPLLTSLKSLLVAIVVVVVCLLLNCLFCLWSLSSLFICLFVPPASLAYFAYALTYNHLAFLVCLFTIWWKGFIKEKEKWKLMFNLFNSIWYELALLLFGLCVCVCVCVFMCVREIPYSLLHWTDSKTVS